MEDRPQQPGKKDYTFFAFKSGLVAGVFIGCLEVFFFHLCGNWEHSEFGYEVIAVTSLAGALAGLFVGIIIHLIRFVQKFIHRDLQDDK